MEERKCWFLFFPLPTSFVSSSLQVYPPGGPIFGFTVGCPIGSDIDFVSSVVQAFSSPEQHSVPYGKYSSFSHLSRFLTQLCFLMFFFLPELRQSQSLRAPPPKVFFNPFLSPQLPLFRSSSNCLRDSRSRVLVTFLGPPLAFLAPPPFPLSFSIISRRLFKDPLLGFCPPPSSSSFSSVLKRFPYRFPPRNF